MPGYNFWLTNDSGRRFADQSGRSILGDLLDFDATLSTDGLGWFRGTFGQRFSRDFLKRDYMVQFYRAPDGFSQRLVDVFFVRRWGFGYDGGRRVVQVEGPCSKDLLRRRIVAAFATSSQAEKSDYADDMMKEVVTEAHADGVSPTPDAGTRVLAGLSVQGDGSAGPSVGRAFAFDRLLLPSGAGVLPQIQAAARQAGNEVFFMVVPIIGDNSISFEFRTAIDHPGLDVSSQVTFSEQLGNLANAWLEYDYSDEVNYVYAGGRGREDERTLEQAYSATRYNASLWNRCEAFADARNQETGTEVLDKANATLQQGRPVVRFNGNLLDTQKTRFGVEWGLGYMVQVDFAGFAFDALVRAVSISAQMGRDGIRERITSRAEYESEL